MKDNITKLFICFGLFIFVFLVFFPLDVKALPQCDCYNDNDCFVEQYCDQDAGANGICWVPGGENPPRGYCTLCECSDYGKGWHDAPFWGACSDCETNPVDPNKNCKPCGQAYAYCDGCFWDKNWNNHKCEGSTCVPSYNISCKQSPDPGVVGNPVDWWIEGVDSRQCTGCIIDYLCEVRWSGDVSGTVGCNKAPTYPISKKYSSAGTKTATATLGYWDIAGNWHVIDSDSCSVYVGNPPDVPNLTAPPIAWINYNPNFKATVSDPDGGNVQAFFNIIGVVSGAVGNSVPSGGTSCYLSDCSTGVGLADGEYNWQAQAKDPQGLKSAWTPYRWVGIDKTAPNCDSMTLSPASPDTGDTVTFSVSASDATSGVASIEIFVDGVSKKTCSASTTCSYTGGPYSAGNHPYSASVRDNAGNTDLTPCSGSFNVVVLGVSVTLQALPYNYGVPGFSPELKATVAGTASGNITYKFDCTNNGSFEHTTTTTTNPYSYSGCSYNSDSQARVEVTREGLTADATVNLYISTFAVTPDPAGVVAGYTIQFTATYDKDGPNGSAASQNVNSPATWSSTNTGVATINSTGLATGVSAGTTTIRATYNPPTGGSLTDTATLNVGSRISSYRVKITGLNRPPTATSLTRTNPDWCASPPIYFFSWTYSDPDGDTESRFDFQVDLDTNPDNGAVVNRSYPGLSNPSPSQNTQSVTVAVSAASGYLTYGKTYYWRVKVWDDNGADSGWVNGASFTTQSRPWPLCDFSWLPESPNAEEGVQFTDESTCYDDVSTGSPCNANDSFNWTFQNANPATSNIQNPTTTFLSRGNKQVTLTVNDGTYSCTATKTVSVSFPLPRWKEIKPW